MVLDLQLPVQSVHITTNVVTLNPAHGEEYLKQHDVVKFVSNLCRSVISLGTLVSSTTKTDRHNIGEILLKVVLLI